ncbi:MAG: transcription-repair coupling factor [Marinilabiliaceae bacterium]|nr:transcription-repair coupling factor [Marinilabiliaceae bacterium]
MEVSSLLQLYKTDKKLEELKNNLQKANGSTFLKGVTGSISPIIISTLLDHGPHLVVLQDKEEASFFYHDLTQLINKDAVFFLTSSFKRSPEYGQIDTPNIILRTEALNRMTQNSNNFIIVTCPEAIIEKVPTKNQLKTSTLEINTGDLLDIEFIVDILDEYSFQRVDFVFEPGQYSVRGSIIDIYSFSNEDPYRIDFFGKEVDSIRTFDLENQLSKQKLGSIAIIPNLSKSATNENTNHLLQFVSPTTKIWIETPEITFDRINKIYEKIEAFNNIETTDENDEIHVCSIDQFSSEKDIKKALTQFPLVFWGSTNQKSEQILVFNTNPQPVFHKNFELLESDLKAKNQEGYQCFILSDNKTQLARLRSIFEDRGLKIRYEEIDHALHAGFIDKELKLSVYTDHQIFERYHKFSLRTDKARSARQSISMRELNRLNPGDYVVHIDHGIGKFGGLVTQEVNGKPQESIKLVFRDNDVLLVSIHSLHRISKYKSKEGEPPKINKLGTAAWKNLKEKTKNKVKDIARELIALYAKRKSEPGFAFSPDSFMQNELEASFFFEDTPDQEKSTKAVKEDMESSTPMDRLVCGDVGFGKTEIAIRAAFKAAADNKQVAVLVPTTILALQHYKTFSERLKDFPVEIDYISRLRKSKDTSNALKKLKEGNLNIVIGTHRLIGKDVEFKDLGLLIIDEEQRFGVAIKEKLKQFRVNVDTLTLTATPIPRTLQFSLMGARDLSILNTPPPNRQPIITELHSFNEQIIVEAIQYEVERGGQVFFINNRVQNILEIEKLVNQLLPDVKTIVAHGQMEGQKLETIMLDFINGDYDVLIATTIIESGLDIPNANTIIINNAHNFGLSELHQLRGRVGRSNKKAFCYLLAPPLTTLTQDARRRLKIIEEFSDLGSGFNIAMQDLDIRGAGNLLGGEQSGFISDIGFETYHRILNEAMLELRDTEFKDLFTKEKETTKEPNQYTSDCQIETDVEILLPETYIQNIAERMQLYRELDNISDEDTLTTFASNLIDRFGQIPNESLELLDVVRVRWVAQKLGIEKIILKNNLLIIYFISDKESFFYQSTTFTKILGWVQVNSKRSKMQETRDRLSVRVPNISSIEKLKLLLDDINSFKS